MPKKTFTVEDLQRWREKGLISIEQLQRIVTDEDLEINPEANLTTPTETDGKKTRLNPVNVAYYFGGFLALLSFTIFIAIRWGDFSEGERLITALVILLTTGCLGTWLRFVKRFRVAGGLILLITAAVFPMFVFTLADITGLWPEGGSFEELSYAFLYMNLISLPIAVLLLALTRFHLIFLVVAGIIHFMALAIGGIVSADLALVTSITCGVFILSGIGLTLYRKPQYTFWLKLYGLMGLQVGFTILFSDSDSALFGILYLVVYLVLIGFSVRFQEVIYLVFGVIGVYTYIIRLIFDYLRGTAYFPLVVGIIGISIVILAVLYQRYKGGIFHRKHETAEKQSHIV
ncbi:MAG TPA: DUF2157 domain-containing protein [Dehalococcoidia bacterium]|nr:DUF2157 domain-containing protein [Dehalococcoidia bacterium]